jgi:hypothetical protein
MISGRVHESALPSSRQRSLLAVFFFAWLAAVTAGAAVHETWWDESQAWLLARDVPVGELVLHRLAYEGHPPLWHLLLALPAKAGLPFFTMKVVAIAASALAVACWMFLIPGIPLLLRLMAPFTYFLAWQFTVVARNYVLLAPILLAIVVLRQRRPASFLPFIALLVALTDVAAHGAVIGAAILVTAIPSYFRVVPRRTLALGLAAWFLNGCLLAWILRVPPDLATRGELGSPVDAARIRIVAWWVGRQMLWGELSPSGAAQTLELLFLAGAAAILCLWIARRAELLLLSVLAASALLGVSAIYFNLWHEGAFFVLLLYVAACAFAAREGPRTTLEKLAIVVLVVIFTRHIVWSVRSFTYDYGHAYTGSRAAAEFIRRNGLEGRLYGMGIRTLEIQPYFERNVLANWKSKAGAAWDWSASNDWPYPGQGAASAELKRRWYVRTLASKPEYVITAWGFKDERLYARALSRNDAYRRVATFPGQTYWKYARSYPIVFELYARRDAAEPALRER